MCWEIYCAFIQFLSVLFHVIVNVSSLINKLIICNMHFRSIQTNCGAPNLHWCARYSWLEKLFNWVHCNTWWKHEPEWLYEAL